MSYGTSIRAYDGDTEEVRVDGDPAGSPPVVVRNIGIQAMETGQCHAAEAKAAMGALTNGKRVRLSAVNPATSSLGRAGRTVDVQTAAGWSDVQTAMLRRGQALFLGSGTEAVRWKAQQTASQQAARARVNLFDTDFCRPGPAQDAALRLWAMWDGNGNEAAAPNAEYVRILNASASALSLRGWWLRTAGNDAYRFPSSAKVPAGGYVTVRVGTGANTATTFHWRLSGPKFPNADVARNVYGSGAYLFDPDGDLRAWSMYPCLYACSDPLAARVRVSVRADAAGVDQVNVNGEYAHLSPAGPYTVDLSYRVLASNGYTYEFPKGSWIRAGETMVVHMGKGTTSRLRQYWGNPTAGLVNSGGRMELRSAEAVRIACRSWGTGRC